MDHSTTTIDKNVALQKVTELKDIFHKLPAKDKAFATSLMQSVIDKGPTKNRMYWIEELIQRAHANIAAAEAPQQTSTVGSFAKVKALFDLAKESLKKPRIRLMLADRTQILIGMASSKGQHPGTIDVTTEGSYGNSKYLGRISLDGSFTENAKYADKMPELRELLTRLGAAPAQVAAEHGRLTGRCCFCSLKLTDPRSTAVGFGLTCAGHYGLTDAWKESDALLGTREALQLAGA